MSIVPGSGSLVRFENPVLITAPTEKDRKGLAGGKHGASFDGHQTDNHSGAAASGLNSQQASRRPGPPKDSSLEEILDKIIPPK